MIWILVFLIFLLMPSFSLAEQAILTWTANTETDLRGYRLYHSTQSGSYTEAPIFIAKPATSYVYVLPDAGATDVTHYFRLTAIDDAADRNVLPSTQDNESEPSVEVSKKVPAIIAASVGSAVLTIVPIDETTVVVSWPVVMNGVGGSANIDLRYQVGSTINWGNAPSASCIASPCTISGLQPDTDYSFKAIWYRGTLNVSAVFGSFSAVANTRTKNVPPNVPKGFRIESALADEIVVSALVADCSDIVILNDGSTATILKRTMRCVK